MAKRVTEIGRLIRRGARGIARGRVWRAIYSARGSILATARILQVERKSVERWIYVLDLVEHLDAVRRRYGGARGKKVPGGVGFRYPKPSIRIDTTPKRKGAAAA